MKQILKQYKFYFVIIIEDKSYLEILLYHYVKEEGTKEPSVRHSTDYLPHIHTSRTIPEF